VGRDWETYAVGAAVLVVGGVALWPRQAERAVNKVVRVLTDGPVQQGLCRALADKWSPVFGVPSDWIMAICQVESAFKPGATSQAASDAARGRAWGAMQVTLQTAQGLVPRLQASSSPAVKATMAKWDGTGESLHDADLGILFGTFQLSLLRQQFGDDFAKVAAAYNQGAGRVQKLIAAGTWPTGLSTHGQSYVAKTDAARQEAIG
jgi:soluble lytic murein transglycosylase-like protein